MLTPYREDECGVYQTPRPMRKLNVSSRPRKGRMICRTVHTLSCPLQFLKTNRNLPRFCEQPQHRVNKRILVFLLQAFEAYCTVSVVVSQTLNSAMMLLRALVQLIRE